MTEVQQQNQKELTRKIFALVATVLMLYPTAAGYLNYSFILQLIYSSLFLAFVFIPNTGVTFNSRWWLIITTIVCTTTASAINSKHPEISLSKLTLIRDLALFCFALYAFFQQKLIPYTLQVLAGLVFVFLATINIEIT